MPRIDDQLLDSVVYLYPTVADAETALGVGGTGFLVCVPSPSLPGFFYRYAITNAHIITANPDEGRPAAPVVRLNTQDGATDILPLTVNDWKCATGDDLAAAHLGRLDSAHFKFVLIPMEKFLTKELVTSLEIGPGDETFMVGRFINHEGQQRNLPAVRFGNIAMMPGEPIMNRESGQLQEAFLVETRSLPGYSGSPVFVHIIPGTRRPSDPPGAGAYGNPPGPWLLGVDYGHLPVWTKAVEKGHERDAVVPGRTISVESNSGQMCVVPAWKLRDLLYCEEFVARRQQSDDQIKGSLGAIILDHP